MTRSPLILAHGHRDWCQHLPAEGIQARQVPISCGEDHGARSHSGRVPQSAREASWQGLGLPLLSRLPHLWPRHPPFLELHWAAQPVALDYDLTWELLPPPGPSKAVPVHAWPLCSVGLGSSCGCREGLAFPSALGAGSGGRDGTSGDSTAEMGRGGIGWTETPVEA